MKVFMDEKFLLDSDAAVELYKSAADLPIIDYHCHLDAKEIYENKKFRSITEAWLNGDHYKWRAMRNMGIDEDLITGNASDYQRFVAWATVMPYLAGNPLYHFSHMELKYYLDTNAVLTPETAEEIYAAANAKLSTLGARDLMAKANVECAVTTNDPIEDLKHHRLLKEEGFGIKVLPAFRPDKAVNIDKAGFKEYIAALSVAAGEKIEDFDSLVSALESRLAYFISMGCPASDHGLDYVPAYSPDALSAETAFAYAMKGKPLTKADADNYKFELLRRLGILYHKYDIVMELHFGCVRNPNNAMFAALGADAGFDCVRSLTGADALFGLMDALSRINCLPRTILFSLNAADNEFLVSLAGAFNNNAGIPGKVQQGSAWWFNDHLEGMRRQISTFAAGAPIGSFVGMLTDSRSFLSYARHDYFRRIFCNYLGSLVENGQYPASSIDYLKEIARNVAYYNAKRYFNL